MYYEMVDMQIYREYTEGTVFMKPAISYSALIFTSCPFKIFIMLGQNISVIHLKYLKYHAIVAI